jgi:hypothetical protein
LIHRAGDASGTALGEDSGAILCAAKKAKKTRSTISRALSLNEIEQT